MAEGLNVAGYLKGFGARGPARPGGDDEDDPVLGEILAAAAKADRNETVGVEGDWTEDDVVRALRGG